MRKIVLLSALFWSGAAAAAEPDASVSAARGVMDEFMAAFNSRDEARWAETLLFPHVRFASGGVVVHEDKQAFVAAMDMDEFARANNWGHSAWDSVEVIQAGPDKVHFKVKFSRFRPNGERYVTFDSLYILQRVEGRWGIRARSSFAP